MDERHAVTKAEAWSRATEHARYASLGVGAKALLGVLVGALGGVEKVVASDEHGSAVAALAGRRLLVETLADRMGVGRRSVQRYAAELVDAGLLGILRTGRSSLWTVYLPCRVKSHAKVDSPQQDRRRPSRPKPERAIKPRPAEAAPVRWTMPATAKALREKCGASQAASERLAAVVIRFGAGLDPDVIRNAVEVTIERRAAGSIRDDAAWLASVLRGGGQCERSVRARARERSLCAAGAQPAWEARL